MTWEEAEALFPGCKEAWEWMCGPDGRDVPGGNDYRPRGPIEVRLELEDGRDVVSPTWYFLKIIQLDPEGYWQYPPEWRYWGEGEFTHPIPMPKSLYEINRRWLS